MDSQKQTGALLIAASIIAVIRLRGEDMRPSPKLNAVVYDSIDLARMILQKIEARSERQS